MSEPQRPDPERRPRPRRRRRGRRSQRPGGPAARTAGALGSAPGSTPAHPSPGSAGSGASMSPRADSSTPPPAKNSGGHPGGDATGNGGTGSGSSGGTGARPRRRRGGRSRRGARPEPGATSNPTVSPAGGDGPAGTGGGAGSSATTTGRAAGGATAGRSRRPRRRGSRGRGGSGATTAAASTTPSASGASPTGPGKKKVADTVESGSRPGSTTSTTARSTTPYRVTRSSRAGGPRPGRGRRPRPGTPMRTYDETSAGGLVLDGLDDMWDAATGTHSTVDLRVALIGRLDRRGRMLWSMPKGHIEPGETREETAIREVREETGVDAEVLTPLGSIDYWFVSEGKRIHKTVHHFVLRYTGGTLSDEDPEVTEVRWVRFDELPRILAYADERRLAHRAADLVPQRLAPRAARTRSRRPDRGA